MQFPGGHMMRKIAGMLGVLGALGLVGFAHADDATKCEAAKNKIAGRYALCRQKAEAKAIKSGNPPNYAACDARFGARWVPAETNGGGQCPTIGDQASERAELTANADHTAWKLSGAPRLVDNADGTITDNQTNLTWERKIALDGSINLANLHDADNSYAWSGTCSLNTGKFCQPTPAAAALCLANVEGGTFGCDECAGGDGTCSATETVWTWALALNMAGFGGHTDWRLPKRSELESVVDLTLSSPAIDVAFQGASCGGACTDIADPACSCTHSVPYWTAASTYAPFPGYGWSVTFYDGEMNISALTLIGFTDVRAVRGGS
jgi:hypothetical protein